MPKKRGKLKVKKPEASEPWGDEVRLVAQDMLQQRHGDRATGHGGCQPNPYRPGKRVDDCDDVSEPSSRKQPFGHV